MSRILSRPPQKCQQQSQHPQETTHITQLPSLQKRTHWRCYEILSKSESCFTHHHIRSLYIHLRCFIPGLDSSPQLTTRETCVGRLLRRWIGQLLCRGLESCFQFSCTCAGQLKVIVLSENPVCLRVFTKRAQV